MKTRFAFSAVGVVAILATALATTATAGRADEPAKPTAATAAPEAVAAHDASAVERGGYLVTAGGCSDCHTPKKMGPEGPELDESRLLSGHPEGELAPPPELPEGPWIAAAYWDLTAWSGPWGVSFAANLTPDENTGLGIWTEEMFVSAIRTGKHMGQSRPILPPMPWPAIRHYSDEDLAAIFAYLRSIPAIHNRVPQPLPPPAAAEEAPAD